MHPPQAGGVPRSSNRGKNGNGPSSRVPNFTAPGGFPNIDPPSYQASSQQSGVGQAPLQRAPPPNSNAQGAYGLGNHSPQYHNTNHFGDFHYQLHPYRILIDPSLLSPHSAFSNGAGSNPVFGNFYGSTFGNGPVSGNGPVFGNRHDTTYSTSIAPGIANHSRQSDMLPSYDAEPPSLSNQAALSDMGTDVGLMHAMDVVKQGSINFNRNTFADHRDNSPGHGFAPAYHPQRPSDPSLRLDRPVDTVTNPLSDPSVLSNGSKRSRQQSIEPDEHPAARRQKLDGDGTDQHGLVNEDNDDAEDGDDRDEADAEHESASSEADSYNERLP